MVCGFSIILSFVHVQNSIDFSKSLQGVALPCSKLTEGLDRSQKGKQYFHPVDSGGVAELGSWKVSRRRNLLYMEKVLSSALEGQWTTALEGGIRSCFFVCFFYPQKHNKVNGLLCHKFSGMRQRDRITRFALFYDLSIGFTIHPHQLKLENMFLSPHCCKFLHNVYFSQLNFL